MRLISIAVLVFRICVFSALLLLDLTTMTNAESIERRLLKRLEAPAKISDVLDLQMQIQHGKSKYSSFAFNGIEVGSNGIEAKFLIPGTLIVSPEIAKLSLTEVAKHFVGELAFLLRSKSSIDYMEILKIQDSFITIEFYGIKTNGDSIFIRFSNGRLVWTPEADTFFNIDRISRQLGTLCSSIGYVSQCMKPSEISSRWPNFTSFKEAILSSNNFRDSPKPSDTLAFCKKMERYGSIELLFFSATDELYGLVGKHQSDFGIDYLRNQSFSVAENGCYHAAKTIDNWIARK